jgi:6-phosphogluconate dehydrogenase
MVGLGKMGANMVQRLRRDGHQVVGYARSESSLRDVASLPALVQRLSAPRVVWVMVPSGEPTRQTVRQLADLLEPGDLVIDGGNSKYTDDAKHAKMLAGKGIGYLDVGVSGGVWGLENGYALMVGGEADQVERVQPVFDTLKPAGDGGFVHAGPAGAGHFTKMVHNGIEYGIMQAYAEGYELLAANPLVHQVTDIFASWRQGTVVRSWLLDLLVRALQADPKLDRVRGWAEDSGEGRWTVAAAIDHAVPLPVISAALFARFSSRQEDSPAMKVVAALRNQFGGHAILPETAAGDEQHVVAGDEQHAVSGDEHHEAATAPDHPGPDQPGPEQPGAAQPPAGH